MAMLKNTKYSFETSLPLWIVQSCEYLARKYHPSAGTEGLTRADLLDQIQAISDNAFSKTLPWGEEPKEEYAREFESRLESHLSERMEIYDNPEIDVCQYTPECEGECWCDEYGMEWDRLHREEREAVYQDLLECAQDAKRINNEFVQTLPRG